jgi:hypothetical protein
MDAPIYGIWLLLGIVFAPFYLTLAGWFLGRPRDLRLPLIGLGFLIGLTALAWGGMALFGVLIHLVLY